MNGHFDPETLRLLDETQEVDIETRQEEGSPTHRTVVWVVVMSGEVFVRSVRGPKGRWYREISANPTGALPAGGQRIPVRAALATDGPTTDAVSDAYRSKYEREWPGPTAAMVRAEALPTTLKLSPA
jgi:hypothetical protein